jgi:flagellar biosynthesis/type III secretory pathway chaperone
MEKKLSGQIDGDQDEAIRLRYSDMITNLDRELSIQGSMLQILGEEKVALTMASTEAILETNARKEATLLKAKEIAAERQGIIERFRSNPQWTGKKATLSRFVELAPDAATAGALKARQHALTTLADTIRTHNRRNSELINAALKDVRGSLNLIQSMVSPGGNYQKTGQLSLNSTQGSLIYREG